MGGGGAVRSQWTRHHAVEARGAEVPWTTWNCLVRVFFFLYMYMFFMFCTEEARRIDCRVGAAITAAAVAVVVVGRTAVGEFIWVVGKEHESAVRFYTLRGTKMAGDGSEVGVDGGGGGGGGGETPLEAFCDEFAYATRVGAQEKSQGGGFVVTEELFDALGSRIVGVGGVGGDDGWRWIGSSCCVNVGKNEYGEYGECRGNGERCHQVNLWKTSSIRRCDHCEVKKTKWGESVQRKDTKNGLLK